jgi:uncharacterized protein YndB with AHSA1/START domain
MPRQKDLKRLVRNRMKKTGESYTAARVHIVNKPVDKAPPPDYAALAGKSDELVATKTGCNWERWVHTLDKLGAATMAHRDIFALVHEKFKVDMWWAQTVTVGYERIKGLREKGQLRSGFYEVNKTRTFSVPVAELFDACADEMVRHRWLTDAVPVVRTARRPRSLRLGWDDGTIVVLGFTEKAREKSVIAIQHTKLPDRATAERLKEHWSSRLDALAELLAR